MTPNREPSSQGWARFLPRSVLSSCSCHPMTSWSRLRHTNTSRTEQIWCRCSVQAPSCLLQEHSSPKHRISPTSPAARRISFIFYFFKLNLLVFFFSFSFPFFLTLDEPLTGWRGRERKRRVNEERMTVAFSVLWARPTSQGCGENPGGG